MNRRAVSAAVLALVTAWASQPARAQFGGFGGFDEPKASVVARFDKDGDKRLNDTERGAARAYLESQPAGFRRQRFGFASTQAARGRAMSPADLKPPFPLTPLYDTATLRTIFIDFSSDDWERELSTFYNTDVEVPATVTVDGQVYRDVGVHFRGNSSYRMVPQGSKRSLNLTLDDVHKEQALRGYTTLNLLNSHEDPTFLRTVLSQEIARDYMPALKSNYMRVVINHESWGVYVNDQQFDKRFVNEAFKTTGGARWKVPGSPRARGGLEYWGDKPEDYKRTFELKSNERPKAWTDLIRLAKTLNETPVEKLEAALAPMLDVDEALRFLALDVVLTNGDGYWARASDYLLYQDPQGRFHVVPGDMNETFSEGSRGFGFSGALPSATLDPLVGMNDASKPLRSKLLAVPALRARYLTYVRGIAEKWFDWKRLGPLAEKYQALIDA
ncbi:MAG TPA: CotH kinase family protein, partial [Gemmatimonadaceae bacterium]|nr:CotH kinase family protein [Gemmatimonadaceae bacterium]